MGRPRKRRRDEAPVENPTIIHQVNSTTFDASAFNDLRSAGFADSVLNDLRLTEFTDFSATAGDPDGAYPLLDVALGHEYTPRPAE